MPLLKLETTAPLSDNTRKDLLPALSLLIAETMGKPEQYVMVTASEVEILMAGAEGPAAFVDIRSIGGLTDAMNRKLSQKICVLLKESLGVPPESVYLNFTDVPGSRWGANGTTFG